MVLVINSYLPEHQISVKKNFASLLLISGVYFNLWYPIFQVYKSISPHIPDFFKLWQTLIIVTTASMPRLALFWQQQTTDFSKALRSVSWLQCVCDKIHSPTHHGVGHPRARFALPFLYHIVIQWNCIQASFSCIQT